MTVAPGKSERVLVLAGKPRDSSLAVTFLRQANVDAAGCATAAELFEEMRSWDLGAVVVAEEAFDEGALATLKGLLPLQPKWSDLPVILFSDRSGTSVDRLLTSLGGNVTALERPVRTATLITAVRTALRTRRRQYELRDVLLDMETVTRTLEEQDRRKDEFLAMLGHELRNPLTAITGSVYLMQHSKSAAVLEKQPQIIERQARHLARLVDDLLDVSRVTLGKITLDSKPVELCEVAARCVQTYQSQAAGSRHRLRLERCEGDVIVEGDLVRLEQVLSNLVSNAIKYTRPGGNIAVRVRTENDDAILVVEDDGIGMDAELIPKIFDLFTQATPTLDRSHGGLGLGLSLVKSLVERHGGTVAAQSAGPERGSRFEVRIPLSSGGGRRSAAGSAGRAGDARGVRILVVEDNEDARVTMHDLLESWGYTVDTAADGREGLEKTLAQHPAVAIVDIGLPKIDGYEVARQVRAQLDGTSPRLIAVTGYGQPEDRQRALAAGFDHHLPKPVNPAELCRLLQTALRPGGPPST